MKYIAYGSKSQNDIILTLGTYLVELLDTHLRKIFNI